MSRDPVARRLAATALAVALVALVLAGWSAYRSEQELGDLRRAIDRAVDAQQRIPMGPPPTFDTED
ncbi:hypothetical protein [Sandaracinus amylolyticus]|uniref:hypothetical protein n=1 Tax=Sandaracinus amylolyticus TaxID=927083 RepID=UPI001F36ECD7|nr:hypothetical protein [Sandaracinus amylolyticus]UJR80953.1 Hypothetical protein I5071_30040 [Sandaracinus amylolyticus]